MYRLKKEQNTFNVWPSFTDLVTSVFIVMLFFLTILIVKNYVDLHQLLKLEKIVGSIEDDLKELETLMQDEDVKVEDGTIVISSDILFPFDKSGVEDLTPEGRDQIQRIGRKLGAFMESPKNRALFRIIVEGHTDRYGRARYNQDLSFERAQAITQLWAMEEFSEKIDVLPTGLGESRLKIKTGNKYVQRENRRIEIKVMPKFNKLIERVKTEGFSATQSNVDLSKETAVTIP
jgi:outer membrane protein OmpA-like peptidoglycan-associated protein